MSTHITLPLGTNSGKLEPFVYSKEAIPEIWPEMEELLSTCFEETKGMLDSKTTYEWLLEGYATAFATIQENKMIAVLIVMPVQYSAFRSARVIACGGGDLRMATKFIDALEAWALMQGCVELEAWCRPVVARLIHGFGWEHKHTVLYRDLRRKLQ